MNNALFHRGPDHQDIKHFNYKGGQIHCGSTRLSITDSSLHANQPFVLDNKVLLFNGFISNHTELRNTFSGSTNVNFKSSSDTETLFYCLQQKDFCIDELNGMFAFIYIDLDKETIQFYRDRSGIKTLYLFEDDDYLIASSEQKGLIASGLINTSINKTNLSQLLYYKFSPKGVVHKNIQEQKTINQSISDSNHHSLKQILINSLTRNSQNNPCLFFSGGIDSSILLALSKSLNINLPAYSIQFKNVNKNTFKDSFYAEKIARHLNVKLNVLEVHSNQYEDYIEYIKTLDQPIADSAGFLTYLLSKKVKSEGFDVALSGAGADELFGGYNRHLAFNNYLNKIKPNFKLWSLFKAIFPIIKPFLNEEKQRLFSKATRSIDYSPTTTYLNFCSQQSRLKNDKQVFGTKINSIKEALLWDQKNYLQNDVLRISDLASMACGVELRVPFLDNEIIDFANNTSPKTHLKTEKKHLLKEVLREYIPENLINRPKEGFGIPLKEWVKADPRWLNNLNTKNAPIFEYIDIKEWQKIVSDFQAGKNDYATEIWAIIQTNDWLTYHA